MANFSLLRTAILLVCVITAIVSPSETLAQRRSAEKQAVVESPRAVATKAVRAYLATARKFWLESERERLGLKGRPQLYRIYGPYLHCHTEEAISAIAFVMRQEYFPISRNSAYGVCPTWMLNDVPPSVLSTTIQGTYFIGKHASTLSAARDTLRATLKSAHLAAPTDGWLLGQYIRFLAYDGHWREAIAATASCSVEPWLCAALSGYAHHLGGDDSTADAQFAKAIALLPAEDRCGFTDIGPLLPKTQRASYDEQPCQVQNEWAHRYFWLADPALITPLNERRVAHLARRVIVMLQVSPDLDERYDWKPARGGVSVGEMLVRYGWPTISSWMGGGEDSSHTIYLEGRGTPGIPPYSTAEYDGARMAFGAAEVLLTDETRAADTAWQVAAPRDKEARHRLGNRIWWPFEHMVLPRTHVVQFADWQLATFRRESQIQVAAAVDLAPVRAADDSLATRADTLTLLVSPEPGSIVTIAAAPNVTGASAVMSGRLPPVSGVISLELLGGLSERMLGRMRSGYRAPRTLASLGTDSIALSDPVLFRTPAEGLPRDVNEMLPHMLPGISVERGSIGLFWETYGIPVGDSVQFTIAITPKERPGFLRRAVAALRLMTAPVNGVAIGWVDPASAISARDSSGTSRSTPILPRALRVDLSNLSPGDYVIELSATDSKQRTALASRLVRIRGESRD